MRKWLLAALVALFLTVMGGTALADPLPEHPHLLLQRFELTIVDVGGTDWIALEGFRKCVDLAANQALPLHTQHQHVHFGHANEALSLHAGHVVVPAAPFHLHLPGVPPIPWTDCAHLETLLDSGPIPVFPANGAP